MVIYLPVYLNSQTWATVPTVPTSIWIDQTAGIWFNQTGTTSTVPYWNTNQTGTTTSCNTITWIAVEGDLTPTQYYDLARGRIYICRERTEAERARLEQEARNAREAQARWDREQKLIALRARDLLLSHLTAEQRKTFEKGWFVVKGGKTGKKYKINTGSYAGNIHTEDGGRLCCHCDGVPLHDHHLAQMIALKYDEERFLRIANRS